MPTPDSFNDHDVTSEAPPKEATGPSENRQSVPYQDLTKKGTRWKADALAMNVKKGD